MAIAVPLAAAAALAGCGGSRVGLADKAGGATAPLVLDVATDSPEDGAQADALRYFAHRVEYDSQGRLRVRVVYGAGDADSAMSEVGVARFVQAGRFDLGWVPSRNWDELGVESLRALQTPFLITSYLLLDRVLTSPLGTEMLGGLDNARVVGLALVPGELRHPLGLQRPLVRRSDYLGRRIHVPPSRTTDALVRALGAKPVHLSSAQGFKAYVAGKVGGKEYGYLDEFGPIVTANVTFFPTAWTLFVNEKTFAGLDGRRRAALRAAAAETLEYAVHTQPTESALIAAFCHEGGRAATATVAEQAALARATRPVLAWLSRDPQTRALIRRIRALKHALPPPPPSFVPPRCRGAG